MRHIDYNKEVRRTLPDLGTPLLNRIHCTLGMMSEIEELNIAMNPEEGVEIDWVNVGEELTDINWYANNWTTQNGIDISEANVIGADIKPELDIPQLRLLIYDITNVISEIANIDKRELAYNKITHVSEKVHKINLLFIFLDEAYRTAGLDGDNCMQNNIDKLYKRFPLGYSDDKAINRDLVEERKELEK